MPLIAHPITCRPVAMAKQPDPLISFFQRGMAAQKAADDAIAAAMPKKPAADDPSRPIVCRVEALALREILADDSTDSDEVAHREWLKRRIEAEIKKIASIPTKLR